MKETGDCASQPGHNLAITIILRLISCTFHMISCTLHLISRSYTISLCTTKETGDCASQPGHNLAITIYTNYCLFLETGLDDRNWMTE